MSHNQPVMAAVLYILREVFPRFHKWRYVNPDQRKTIGQKCLQLFHKIFSFVNREEKTAGSESGKKMIKVSSYF